MIDDYRISVPQMPAQLDRGMPITTCRYSECPYEHSVFRPGELRCSIESVERCDPEHYRLGIEPRATLVEVRKSPLGPWGLYGKGKEGQEVRSTLFEHESLNLRLSKRLLIRNAVVALDLFGRSFLHRHGRYDRTIRLGDTRKAIKPPISRSIHSPIASCFRTREDEGSQEM